MTTAYKRTALIGGTTTALDGIDGSLLSNGDFAFVFYGNVNYIYQLDADLGGSESVPDIITPDENAGAKRWVLQACRDASATAKGIVELATGSEVLAGTETAKVITPAGLTSKISTSSTLGENSDLMLPSQKSVKSYVDAATVGYSLSDDVTLSGESTTKSPTEHAVKGYADAFIPKVSADNTLSGESTTVVASESAVAGYVEANKTLVSADVTLSGESTTIATAEKAVKDYVDSAITASGTAVPIGHLSGLTVSRKDNDEIYVSGGSVDLGGALYFNNTQRAVAPGGEPFGYTSDICTGGTGSPANAFDNNYNTYSDYAGYPFTVSYDLGAGVSASAAKYTLTFAYNLYASAWTFEGSNDNSNWTTLDTRTGQTTWVWNSAKSYTLSSISAAYRYFRWVFTAGYGAVARHGEAEIISPSYTLSASTPYYIYVDAPGSGVELGASNFIISPTAPSFDSAKGGMYHPTNTDQRAIAHFTTDSNGYVPSEIYMYPAFNLPLAQDATLVANDQNLIPSQAAVKAHVLGKINADATFSGESNVLAPSQKAVKDYIVAQAVKVSADGTFSGESTTVVPSESAVKTYVGSNAIPAAPAADFGMVLSSGEAWVTKTSGESQNILFTMNPLSMPDHSVLGCQQQMLAGEAVVFGDPCYQKNDGKWWKADASSYDTMEVGALAAQTITPNELGLFALPLSYIRDDSWSWTPGMKVYASTNSGEMTHTAPSGETGNLIQILGRAYSSDVLFFNPELITVEVEV